MRKSRRVDLTCVSLIDGYGRVVRSVVATPHLHPGVTWAYRAECPDNCVVRERYLGKGRLDGYKVVDLVPPTEAQRPNCLSEWNPRLGWYRVNEG